MVTESLANEAIALTAKKVDMALDDIIKMSKNATNKGKKPWRGSNKSKKLNGGKPNALKVRQYLDSRSVIRQGALAKRRSKLQGNQFSLTTEAAQKAAVAPRGRRPNSSRVANSKESRFGATQARRVTKRDFTSKVPQKKEKQEQHGNGAAQQRPQPQTLDSLFANMREQRMMTFSSQPKDDNVGGDSGRRPRAPWPRRRRSN